MATLYRASYLSPQNIAIDMSSNQNFTCQVNGTIATTYRIRLYRVDTSALLYDTGTLTLSSPLYDKQTLTHTITGGTVTYAGQIKWTILIGNGSTTVLSLETPFWNWLLPTYTMTVPATITTKSYEFTATYNQSQGIAISKFKFIWYADDDTVIQDTGWIYSADTKYTFDGFIAGTDYKVESICHDEYDVEVSTGKKNFTIDYAEPQILMVPITELDEDTSAVQIDWGDAVDIPGVGSGSYSYIDDYLVEGNTGLHLESGASVYWDVAIPLDFTATFILQLPEGFSGVFCQLDTDYSIGYQDGRFFFDNHGVFDYGLPFPVGSNPFLVAIRPTNIYVRYIGIYNLWQDFATNTWNSLASLTWDDVKYKN